MNNMRFDTENSKCVSAKRSEGGRLGGLYRGYFKVHSPPKKEKK